MDGKVRGGRQKSVSEDELSTDDADEGNTTSRSLPRMSLHRTSAVPGDDGPSVSLTAPPAAGKKKARSASFRAFGTMVQRFVHQVSQASFYASPRLMPKSERQRREGEGSEGVRRRSSDTVPGVVGLRNHGNTCFMNAVLQCLSNTDLLVEYFVLDQYKQDLKRHNKRNAKKYGTKGELTEHLALLLKSLWTSKYVTDISSEFKSVVGKYASQYRGSTQHDAQEFLMWLLDKVHEDLNIATKKKYKMNKSSAGRSDEAVAQEALANHNRCNNSYVYSLFQALYRSSLTCPLCRRQSNTFEPFLSVSLPIPQKTRRPVYVTVVFSDARPRQVRIALLLLDTDCIADLRLALTRDTNIPSTQIILTEVLNDGFHRTFSDSEPVAGLFDSDNIYAIETPGPPNSELLTVVAANTLLTHRFGGVYLVRVSRDVSFSELQRALLHEMHGMLRPDARPPGPLSLCVVDGLPDQRCLPPNVDLPLYMPTVDRALASCSADSGPPHIKLLIEWDQKTKHSVVSCGEEDIEDHQSVRRACLLSEPSSLSTLHECFRLYTQEERLSGEDAWLCPGCRRRQQGTIKSLSLWLLPDILVIHLKRFKLDDMTRDKLNSLVTFPISGLDMSHHVAKQHIVHQQHKTGWSPWRPARKQGEAGEQYMYDLYAVCNHYGNMQGGHYTAFCKNPGSGQWFSFDDNKVTPMSESQLVSRAAYILFYERRSTRRAPESSHWSDSLSHVSCGQPPGETKPVSQSHEDLLQNTGTESSDARPVLSPGSYHTLPSSQRTSHTLPPEMVPCTRAPSTSAPQASPVSSLTSTSEVTCKAEEGEKSSSPTSTSPSTSPSTASTSRPLTADISPTHIQNHTPNQAPTPNHTPYHTATPSDSPTKHRTPSQSQGGVPNTTPIQKYSPPSHQSPSQPINTAQTLQHNQTPTHSLSPSQTPDINGRPSTSSSVSTVSRQSSVEGARRPSTRAQPSTPHRPTEPRSSLVRSVTSPEVASARSYTVTRRGNQEQELHTWERNRTIFLQESSV